MLFIIKIQQVSHTMQHGNSMNAKSSQGFNFENKTGSVCEEKNNSFKPAEIHVRILAK